MVRGWSFHSAIEKEMELEKNSFRPKFRMAPGLFYDMFIPFVEWHSNNFNFILKFVNPKKNSAMKKGMKKYLQKSYFLFS